MEENQNSSLFGLGIDPAAKAHLTEAARWARFLSILGFILLGLLVLAGIFAGSIFGMMGQRVSGGQIGASEMAGMGGLLAFVYIFIAVIYFFPCLFLFRFANKMKAALIANDQETLNASFQNLKILFRYVGIITIIILAFYAIMLLFGLLAAGIR